MYLTHFYTCTKILRYGKTSLKIFVITCQYVAVDIALAGVVKSTRLVAMATKYLYWLTEKKFYSYWQMKISQKKKKDRTFGESTPP